MQPPIPLAKTLMTLVMILSISLTLYPSPWIILPVILSLGYLIHHSMHYLKRWCTYKDTQYYALYKTPFSHLIKNTKHYKQYIIYQTLLSVFATNSDILISTHDFTVLLIHPSGVMQFTFEHKGTYQKHIATFTFKTPNDLKKIIQKVAHKKPIYSQPKVMQLYDIIMTNPRIPFN